MQERNASWSSAAAGLVSNGEPRMRLHASPADPASRSRETISLRSSADEVGIGGVDVQERARRSAICWPISLALALLATTLEDLARRRLLLAYTRAATVVVRIASLLALETRQRGHRSRCDDRRDQRHRHSSGETHFLH